MVGRLKVLLYLVTGIPLGIAGAAVLLCGWIVVACSRSRRSSCPALVGFRAATGGLAWLEARLANALLGTDARAADALAGGRGFWEPRRGVCTDGAFWRQQVYLLQASVLSGAARDRRADAARRGCDRPAPSRSLPLEHPGDRLAGTWTPSIARSFSSPSGSRRWRSASACSGRSGRSSASSPSRSSAGHRGRDAGEPRGPPARLAVACSRPSRRRSAAVVVIVWASTGGGGFWPEWVLLSLALVLGLHVCVVAVLEHQEEIRRERLTPAVAIEAGFALPACLFLIGVWAAAGGGYFWPAWAIARLGRRRRRPRGCSPGGTAARGGSPSWSPRVPARSTRRTPS